MNVNEARLERNVIVRPPSYVSLASSGANPVGGILPIGPEWTATYIQETHGLYHEGHE